MYNEDWKRLVLSQPQIDDVIRKEIPGWEPPALNSHSSVLSDRELENLLAALSESESDILSTPEPEPEPDLSEVLSSFEHQILVKSATYIPEANAIDFTLENGDVFRLYVSRLCSSYFEYKEKGET